MTPTATTTEPETRPEADDVRPEDVGVRVEKQATHHIDRSRETLAEILGHLERAAALVPELRRAGASARMRRVEGEVLEAAHGLDLELPDAPDREEALSRIESAVDAVREALQGETDAERAARSARTVWTALTSSSGGPDEKAMRARQVRDRLGSPDWLDDETIKSAWIDPARERHLDALRARIARRALRWCRSAWRGTVPGDPEDAFPSAVATVVSEFIEDGATAPHNGDWAVPRRWYPRHASPNHTELDGRDLEAEIEEAVAGLPDAVLEEVAG